jgi:hypothetical protein
VKCHNRKFISINPETKSGLQGKRPVFPDTLVDYLSGMVIPFSNRDNIRQRLVKALIEEKGYLKEDISLDRVITFEIEGQQVCSLVDISIGLDGNTLMVCKCASGSVVSRERQVIAAARLLEDYIIPFAVVTNGINIELLDAISEKVIGDSMQLVPTRQKLLENSKNLTLKSTKNKKLVNEQRILYTYDEISCNISSRNSPAT